ncbi:hypothetical protein LXL04_011915 [Taraxacum kok-saghyz]
MGVWLCDFIPITTGPLRFLPPGAPFSRLPLQIRNPLLRFCIIDFCYIIVNQFKFKFCIRFLQLVQSIFA